MAKDANENAPLHATSFLQGHNQIYVEQLYARWVADAASVDPSWSAYFESLRDDPGAVREEAAGAPWARSDWPPTANGELVAALDGQWDEVPDPKSAAKKIAAKAKAEGKPLSEEALRAAVLDSDPRHHVYPLLPLARASGRRSRSAAPHGPRASPGIRALLLRFRGEGSRPADLHQQGARARDRDDARDLGAAEAHLSGAPSRSSSCICRTPSRKPGCSSASRASARRSTSRENGRRAILNKLIEAEGIEKYLHVKYTGTKRFGLDGGEALVPAMEQIIKRGGALGAKEIVIGMPHRGRLNVLANVMAKPYRAIFNEFQGGSFKPRRSRARAM